MEALKKYGPFLLLLLVGFFLLRWVWRRFGRRLRGGFISDVTNASAFGSVVMQDRGTGTEQQRLPGNSVMSPTYLDPPSSPASAFVGSLPSPASSIRSPFARVQEGISNLGTTSAAWRSTRTITRGGASAAPPACNPGAQCDPNRDAYWEAVGLN